MTTPAEILERTRTIVVVGLSTDPEKEAHRIPSGLSARGFDVIGVHPSATELLGAPVFRSLAEVPAEVDIDLVNVFRPAEEAPAVTRAAVERGAKAVWLQAGIASPEARRIADEAGIDYVEDTCAGTVAARHDIRHA